MVNRDPVLIPALDSADLALVVVPAVVLAVPAVEAVEAYKRRFVRLANMLMAISVRQMTCRIVVDMVRHVAAISNVCLDLVSRLGAAPPRTVKRRSIAKQASMFMGKSVKRTTCRIVAAMGTHALRPSNALPGLAS